MSAYGASLARWAALLLAVWALTATASARPGPPPLPETCLEEIARAERDFRLPPQLLRAIAPVESGRVDPRTGQLAPWVWSIDVNGAGQTFAAKEQAIAATEQQLMQGNKSVDVGCMQVNLSYHPAAFASLDEAFTPAANVRYAATFLVVLNRQLGSWEAAAKAYHSQSPGLGDDYLRRVAAFWPAGAARLQFQPPSALRPSRPPVPPNATPELAAWLSRTADEMDKLKSIYGASALLRPSKLRRPTRMARSPAAPRL
jgi:hypothetical protein